MPSKAILKKNVLSVVLKVVIAWQHLICSGRLFHSFLILANKVLKNHLGAGGRDVSINTIKVR